MADADLEVPEDLIELRCRWLDADAAYTECERSLPSGADIAAGRAEITDDQRAHSKRLLTAVVELTEAIYAHPWLARELFTRRQALHVAAARRGAAPHASSSTSG